MLASFTINSNTGKQRDGRQLLSVANGWPQQMYSLLLSETVMVGSLLRKKAVMVRAVSRVWKFDGRAKGSYRYSHSLLNRLPKILQIKASHLTVCKNSGLSSERHLGNPFLR